MGFCGWRGGPPLPLSTGTKAEVGWAGGEVRVWLEWPRQKKRDRKALGKLKATAAEAPESSWGRGGPGRRSVARLLPEADVGSVTRPTSPEPFPLQALHQVPGGYGDRTDGALPPGAPCNTTSNAPCVQQLGILRSRTKTVVHKPSEDVLIRVFFWKDAQDWFVAEQVKPLQGLCGKSNFL